MARKRGSGGARGADLRELIRNLTVLAEAARTFGPSCEIPALCHLIAAHFDMQRNMDDFLQLNVWRKCYSFLMRIMIIMLRITMMMLRRSIT